MRLPKIFGNFFKNEKNIILLLLTWIISLSLAYSVLSVVRHNHFESGGFDLGIYDQGTYLLSRGDLNPFSTIKGRLLFGDHLSLTLPLISPIFYIWNDVRFLLIFQAFFISFSTIPIYFMARGRKLRPFSSLIFSIIYSLFFGIQYAVYFDWHAIVIAVGILAWLIYFYESKKLKLFIISLILFILTQENTGLGLASIGFVYLFKKENRKHAIIFILGGVFVSLVEARIIAHLSPIGYEYFPHYPLNPITLFKRYFDSPDKILVWKYALSSYSFLPLLSPGAMMGTFFDLAQYFLPDKQFPHMITPYFHHRAILTPILGLGVLDAIILLKKKINEEILLIIVLLIVCFFQFKYHHALNKLTKPIYFTNYSWMKDNEKIISEVPDGDSVTAQQSLVPHLSHRKEIYLAWPRQKQDLKKCGETVPCWWLDFDGKPKYLIVDLHEGATLTQLLESRENFIKALENMENAGKITLYKSENNAKIYKINY